MHETGVVVTIALVASVAALAVLLLAATRRWFAPFSRGFLLSLLLAIAGLGVGIAAVLGLWAYGASQDALVTQILRELDHVADIQEQEIKEDVHAVQTHLRLFAARRADDARRNP